MARILFLILLLTSFKPAFSLPVSLDFCAEPKQSVLTFREFYVDQINATKRTAELWIDPSEDTLRGFLRRKGQTPVYVTGAMIGKNRFFICEYKRGAKKASGILYGEIQNDQLTLTPEKKAGKLQKLLHIKAPTSPRDYIIKYELRNLVHEDPLFNDGSRCTGVYAYFQIVGEKLTPAQMALNKSVIEIFQSDHSPDDDTKHCLAMKPPRKLTIAINPIFTSNRYISAKIDTSTIDDQGSSMQSQALNFDFEKQLRLERDDLIGEAESRILLKEVKKRVTEIFGSSGRLNSLKFADLSFTPETLIVGFDPVDEKGFYLAAFQIDVPIPLDYIRDVLKISLKGPLKNN